MVSNFISINKSNISIINNLISKFSNENQHFRYFESRDPKTIIENHLYTCVFSVSDIIVGYGHLDRDNDKVWLGMFVLKNFQKKGYGLLILENLIKIARKYKLKDIFLSADETNHKAINLYKKFSFKIVKKEKEKFFMKLQLK